jgi:Arc/MetJ-type ribon-helix-helix transcriptional regulator
MHFVVPPRQTCGHDKTAFEIDNSKRRPSGRVNRAYTSRTQTDATVDIVSIPVTARLSEDVVAALDKAVAAGVEPTRGSLVAAAVHEWLQRHGEDAIAASYERRYSTHNDQSELELLTAISSFSVAACLASEPA